MPQIKRGKRAELDNRMITATDKGDICYMITKHIIIPLWHPNPSWTVASQIRRMLIVEPDLAKLKSLVRGAPFDDTEILNQAAMAYDEFYRRCVGNYEDYKARQNTDVYTGVQYAKAWARVQEETQ